MNTEFKPLKVTFQISRNLSDFRKPRYTAKLGLQVVADGRTPNEVKVSVNETFNRFVTPEFLVMAE